MIRKRWSCDGDERQNSDVSTNDAIILMPVKRFLDRSIVHITNLHHKFWNHAIVHVNTHERASDIAHMGSILV